MSDVVDVEAWRWGTPQSLTAQQAIDLVRHLATEGCYRFTEHALDRMYERHIVASQVVSVLKRGDLISGPDRNAQGNWELQLSDMAAGERVTASVAIDSEGIRQIVLVVVVITVF
ncbi:MAG: DUF4258 domain-containing protein [Proteobacteria bacterium]|nr:DUF4258 domain-containing protein [Pseudomonadota bacterium]